MNAFDSCVGTITPFQLKELLDSKNPPIVLDVREVEELKICSLPTYIHIALGNLSSEWDRLPKDQLIITLCHHGYRSLQAALFLNNCGLNYVKNLTGGIDAWATQIDSGMEVY